MTKNAILPKCDTVVMDIMVMLTMNLKGGIHTMRAMPSLLRSDATFVSSAYEHYSNTKSVNGVNTLECIREVVM